MNLEQIRAKQAFIIDMDGVIYHGNRLLPGAKEFVEWLQKQGKNFLFLTNSSEKSQRELHDKLKRMGMEVDSSHFYTSALATASFLSSQFPGGSAYVIGEPGLINALYEAGYAMNEVNPDYVVVGETAAYSFPKIKHAVNLVLNGAKLVATNPDLTDPVEGGVAPATGALVAPIELATGMQAYFVGKPNPVMMRHALRRLKATRDQTVVVGDRMDTDVIAGINADMDTALVLSGVTAKEDLKRFAYSPRLILNGVGDIPEQNA